MITTENTPNEILSFDDAWNLGEELKVKSDFREKVADLEQIGLDENVWMSNEEFDKKNPLKHTFTDGCYVREVFAPADQLLITKIHKIEHPFFLMQGEVSILTEKGVERLKAPHHGITRPGTKRVMYTHSDMVFITVHATDKKTVEEVEDEVIAKDFNDPLVTAEDFELLKNRQI